MGRREVLECGGVPDLEQIAMVGTRASRRVESVSQEKDDLFKHSGKDSFIKQD